MEFVTEIVLFKSGELTLGGGIPSGELIFSEEENGFRNGLDAALCSKIFLAIVFENF